MRLGHNKYKVVAHVHVGLPHRHRQIASDEREKLGASAPKCSRCDEIEVRNRDYDVQVGLQGKDRDIRVYRNFDCTSN